MARPNKDSCDYFSHDNNMRNHKKIKAVRQKFKPGDGKYGGYHIWNMLLEYLTGTDGNSFEYNDLEFELLSGDFDASAAEIKEVVDYCIYLKLLFKEDDFVYSESLDERLSPVYESRAKKKLRAKTQNRICGKFSNKTTVEPDNTTAHAVVSPGETPQSKVKESKVKESEIDKGKREKTPDPAAEPESSLWFIKFLHSDYSHYKQIFNGQSTTEPHFQNWKNFVQMIYDKEYVNLFNAKMVNPHDFAGITETKNFTEEMWEPVVLLMLGTGVLTHQDLRFRIPQYIDIYRKKNAKDGKFNRSSGSGNGKEIKFDKP